MTSTGRHQRFKEWLLEEMDKRGWSQADLARYANLNRAVINKLLNGVSNMPSHRTLIAIARAFKIPVEGVYRASGLLPEISEPDAVTEEILHNLNQLQNKKRKSMVLLLIKALIDEENGDKK
jgi:transcriptional regulator with XRE-family HTH domain